LARRWRVLIALATLPVAAGLFLILGRGAHWVGRTDLRIEIVVTDADTGSPIEGATIHVQTESGGFCREQDGPDFAMAVGRDGSVSRLYHQCMCFGTKTLMRDSWSVHLPSWAFWATAPGYMDGDVTDLGRSHHRVRRGHGGPATLVVPVALHRAVR
jgi:hypothetical protein